MAVATQFSPQEPLELSARQRIEQAELDEDAFASLYRESLPHVYRYILSKVGHVQDAEDLTTQTFMGALQALSTYTGDASFLGWVLGIAKHKIADHFRKKTLTVSLDKMDDFHAKNASPAQTVEQDMQMERIAACLRSISPDRAEAVTLRIYGGLSARETGRIMNRSEDAVHALVSRGLRDLRTRLQVKEIENQS